MEQDKHTFIHEGTLESGEDEYYCPTCGRRILLQMNPYKKTVLDAGDDYAIHNGGKGGLVMDSTQVSQPEESNPQEVDRLAAWEVWLQELNFESYWDRDN